MTRAGHKPSRERTADASVLEQRYGEYAAEYAEVREETARDLGDLERAEQWDRIERELRSGDDR